MYHHVLFQWIPSFWTKIHAKMIPIHKMCFLQIILLDLRLERWSQTLLQWWSLNDLKLFKDWLSLDWTFFFFIQFAEWFFICFYFTWSILIFTTSRKCLIHSVKLVILDDLNFYKHFSLMHPNLMENISHLTWHIIWNEWMNILASKITCATIEIYI